MIKSVFVLLHLEKLIIKLPWIYSRAADIRRAVNCSTDSCWPFPFWSALSRNTFLSLLVAIDDLAGHEEKQGECSDNCGCLKNYSSTP